MSESQCLSNVLCVLNRLIWYSFSCVDSYHYHWEHDCRNIFVRASKQVGRQAWYMYYFFCSGKKLSPVHRQISSRTFLLHNIFLVIVTQFSCVIMIILWRKKSCHISFHTYFYYLYGPSSCVFVFLREKICRWRLSLQLVLSVKATYNISKVSIGNKKPTTDSASKWKHQHFVWNTLLLFFYTEKKNIQDEAVASSPEKNNNINPTRSDFI